MCSKLLCRYSVGFSNSEVIEDFKKFCTCFHVANIHKYFTLAPYKEIFLLTFLHFLVVFSRNVLKISFVTFFEGQKTVTDFVTVKVVENQRCNECNGCNTIT